MILQECQDFTNWHLTDQTDVFSQPTRRLYGGIVPLQLGILRTARGEILQAQGVHHGHGGCLRISKKTGGSVEIPKPKADMLRYAGSLSTQSSLQFTWYLFRHTIRHGKA